ADAAELQAPADAHPGAHVLLALHLVDAGAGVVQGDVRRKATGAGRQVDRDARLRGAALDVGLEALDGGGALDVRVDLHAVAAEVIGGGAHRAVGQIDRGGQLDPGAAGLVTVTDRGTGHAVRLGLVRAVADGEGQRRGEAGEGS